MIPSRSLRAWLPNAGPGQRLDPDRMRTQSVTLTRGPSQRRRGATRLSHTSRSSITIALSLALFADVCIPSTISQPQTAAGVSSEGRRYEGHIRHVIDDHGLNHDSIPALPPGSEAGEIQSQLANGDEHLQRLYQRLKHATLRRKKKRLPAEPLPDVGGGAAAAATQGLDGHGPTQPRTSLANPMQPNAVMQQDTMHQIQDHGQQWPGTGQSLTDPGHSLGADSEDSLENRPDTVSDTGIVNFKQPTAKPGRPHSPSSRTSVPPQYVLIVAQGRTGSTLLTDLMCMNRTDIFGIYEPFHDFADIVTRYDRSKPLTQSQPSNTIPLALNWQSMFDCSFVDDDDAIGAVGWRGQGRHKLADQFRHLRPWVPGGRRWGDPPRPKKEEREFRLREGVGKKGFDLRYKPYVRVACRSSRIRVIKTIRLDGALLDDFVERRTGVTLPPGAPPLKVIHLIRHPLKVAQS
eukprot:m.44331 g.44331  ORF g.44331 m.44331 type:complete len:462 (-) comp6509_c0_seq2:533-1918(-)